MRSNTHLLTDQITCSNAPIPKFKIYKNKKIKNKKENKKDLKVSISKKKKKTNHCRQ